MSPFNKGDRMDRFVCIWQCYEVKTRVLNNISKENSNELKVIRLMFYPKVQIVH
jgi:hypothetical protein